MHPNINALPLRDEHGPAPHDYFREARLAVIGRLRTDYDQARKDHEIIGLKRAGGETGAAFFKALSCAAIDLLAEARTLPTSKRSCACVAYLADVVQRDKAMDDAFHVFDDLIEDADRRFCDALDVKHRADLAWQLGTLDAKEAAKLHAAKVTAEAALNVHDQALLALALPPMPCPALPPSSATEAAAQTEELVRFYTEHGVVFAHDAERPPIDVLAVAGRHGRETSADRAILWPIYEARALKAREGKAREELAEVFAHRARAYDERVTYGEMAR